MLANDCQPKFGPLRPARPPLSSLLWLITNRQSQLTCFLGLAHSFRTSLSQKRAQLFSNQSFAHSCKNNGGVSLFSAPTLFHFQLLVVRFSHLLSQFAASWVRVKKSSTPESATSRLFSQNTPVGVSRHLLAN